MGTLSIAVDLWRAQRGACTGLRFGFPRVVDNPGQGFVKKFPRRSACRRNFFTKEPVDSLQQAPDSPERFLPIRLPAQIRSTTNLANHLQPIIRYDIGDSVRMKPDDCSCGSPLPALRLAGRTSDVLVMHDANGREVTVPPLVIGTVVDAIPGTCRTQVIQTGPEALRLLGAVESGYDQRTVWDDLVSNLRRTLADLGLDNVDVGLAHDEPERVTAAGKFRRVVPLAGL